MSFFKDFINSIMSYMTLARVLILSYNITVEKNIS